MQIPTQNGKMKILLSEFHPRTILTPLLSSNLVSRKKTKYVLRILKFRFLLPKGTPLAKVFELLSRNGFPCSKNGFILFQKVQFS
jgi:hypothetical protein